LGGGAGGAIPEIEESLAKLAPNVGFLGSAEAPSSACFTWNIPTVPWGEHRKLWLGSRRSTETVCYYIAELGKVIAVTNQRAAGKTTTAINLEPLAVSEFWFCWLTLIRRATPHPGLES
jgi:hypothetical protein